MVDFALYLPTHRTLCARLLGDVTIDDFMSVLSHAIEHPEWRPNSHIVYDLRGVNKLVLDLPDLTACRDFVFEHEEKMGLNWATVYVSRDFHVRFLSSLVTQLSRGGHDQYFTTPTMEAAEDLLRLPACTLSALMASEVARGYDRG